MSLTRDVSLVIPGRNCAATLDECLSAVVAVQRSPEARLGEILFVDDGSTDRSAAIARAHGVTVVAGSGRGPGAARNLGWRAAALDLIWFVDSDCIVEPDALALLLAPLADADVAAVGGSYGNACPESFLACLIHEEIVARHQAMEAEVDHLATFNVVYRRSVLAALDGFDERYITAEDAELSFRAREAGYRLRFEDGSRVRHYHAQRLLPYLRTQQRHGRWRVWLHLERPGRAARNSYSHALDHVQPILALVALATSPLLLLTGARWVPLVLVLLVALAQVPMAARLVRRAGARYAAFAALGTVRAFWRGIGMARGALGYALALGRRARGTPSRED